MKFLIENKGQAGAVFQLMVDAIISLAILAIIVYTLTYFNGLRGQISKQQMYEITGYAVNSPTGKVFVSDKDLFFSNGDGFTAKTMESATSKPAECFTFESNLAGTDVGAGSYLKFTSAVEAKIYAKCWLAADPTCIQKCRISVGKPLPEGEN